MSGRSASLPDNIRIAQRDRISPMNRFRTTVRAARAAGRYLAGGGLGLFVLPPELNLVIARGEGSRVWDVAGREYLDYHLSSGRRSSATRIRRSPRRSRRSCRRARRTTS